MSNLEDYIKSNRNELDHIESVDKNEMWQKFSAKKTPQKIWRLPGWATAAAVALLIGVTGVFIGYNLQGEENITFAQLVEEDPVLAETYQELIDQIQDKERKVQAANVDQEEFKALFDELKNLETIQSEFQKDIPNYGQQKELIKTLLKNYDRKIHLLEILLLEIDKKSKYENREFYKNS